MSPAPHFMKKKPLLALAATSASALLLLTGCAGGSSAAEPAASSSASSGTDSISAERCAENKAAGPITFLTSFAFAASPGLLDVVTAEDMGVFDDLCLDVTLQAGSTNAQLVSAGTAQFAGLGSPSDVLTAIDNGADISAVATYGNTVAITLMTNKDVKSLKDLEGKTAGYKGAIPPQIQAMLASEDVDSSKINWVSVGYDPTILPNGQVQALTGYKSNEPLALKSGGFDITQWDPAKYGVKSAFNTQIVNNTFAKEHPTAVEDFLRGSLYSYNWINESDDNLDTALGYAAKRSDAGYDLDASKARWKTEVGLVEDSQPADLPIGGETADQWTPEADMLVKYDLVKGEPDVKSAIDDSFITAIYDGTDLIWPAP